MSLSELTSGRFR